MNNYEMMLKVVREATLDIVTPDTFNIPDGGSYPLPEQPWYVDCASSGPYTNKCPCTSSGACSKMPSSELAAEEGGRKGTRVISLKKSVFIWPEMTDPSDATMALANSTNQLDNFFIPYWRGYGSVDGIYIGFQNGGEMITYPGESPIDFSPYTCPAEVAGSLVRSPCLDDPDVGSGKQLNPKGSGTYNGERQYDPRNRGWYLNAARDVKFGKVHYDGPYLNAFSTKKDWLLTLALAIYRRGANGGYDHTAAGLIGVVGTDLNIATLQTMINGKVFAETGFASLVRPDGTVMASPGWDPDKYVSPSGATDAAPKIYQEEKTAGWKKIGLSQKEFIRITTDKQALDETIFEYELEDASGTKKKWLLAREAVPPRPKTAAERASWVAEFYVLVHVEKEKVQEPLTKMKAEIASSTRSVMMIIVAISLATIFLTSCLIAGTTRTITKPLSEMVEVAELITNHEGAKSRKGRQQDLEKKVNAMHTPNDIIGTLVHEFKALVLGLNNKGQVAAAIVVDDTAPEPNKYARGKPNNFRKPDGTFIWEGVADKNVGGGI